MASQIPELSRTKISGHIAAGKVLVDGTARKASFQLEPGMHVSLAEFEPRSTTLEPAQIDLDIRHEDEYLIVLNKTAGISVHPSPTSREPTLVNALLYHSSSLSKAGGEFRPGIVHRLDKDTSGLLLVAKTDAVHRALQNAIQKREVLRKYFAIVKGVPADQEFTIKSYLGRHPKHRQKFAVVSANSRDARIAITHCKAKCSGQGISLIECSLETGRTHQIRVHLSSVGLPILGDAVYGVAHPEISRQALHACSVSFLHPVSGLRLEFSANMPPDMANLSPCR